MGICDVREIGDPAIEPDLEGAGVAFRRQRARRRRRRFHARQPVGGPGRKALPDVDLGDNLGAVLGKRLVAAGVVAVKMGVDEIFDRLVRDRRDRGLDLVMQRREFAVDHDDAVFCNGDRDIAALAFQHIDVVAEIGGLDLDLGKIRRRGSRGRRLLLRAGGARKPQGGCRCRHCNPKHQNLPQEPMPDSLAYQRIVCASCGRRAKLLECGQETRGRGLQHAAIEPAASQRGNQRS